MEVPGGQQVYVTPAGIISYTEPHSGYIPTGSYISGFTNTTTTSEYLGAQSIINLGASEGGIIACSVPSYMEGTGATYQIYALTPDFNQANCITLNGLLAHDQGEVLGAWEYT